METIRIGLVGAAGRMGQELLQCIVDSGDLRAAALVVEPGSPLVGTAPPVAPDLTYSDDLVAATATTDVLVDFSSPQALNLVIAVASQRSLPLVCGTTGYSSEQLGTLRVCARSVPVFYSPNMSLGIFVMETLVAQAVRAMGPEFDVEVTETHHRRKVDAPSGTALRLARAIVAMRKTDTCQLEGQPAEHLQVPIHSLRGGDIVGDHTVHIMGPGERLEITHRASSRRTFCLGALRAARWLLGQPPGYYGMADLNPSGKHSRPL